MKLMIEIDISNAAFDNWHVYEVESILTHQMLPHLERVGDRSAWFDMKLKDKNGNIVGRAYTT